MKNGFKPGHIYELIYQTQGSKVMGLGMVGIRDLLSFLHYDDVDADGRLAGVGARHVVSVADGHGRGEHEVRGVPVPAQQSR